MPDIYYRDGGTWRKVSQVYYKASGVWRLLKKVYYRDGGTWRQVYQGVGVVNPLPGGTASHSALYTGVGYAGWKFYASGRVYKQIGNTTYDDHLWYDPSTLDIGASHVIRLTKTGGSGSLSNSGVWRSLSADIGVYLTQSGQGYTDLQFLAEIAETSAGPVLGSGNYAINVAFDL